MRRQKNIVYVIDPDEAVHDALADPRTLDLVPGYLEPLGIGAMLNAPIRAGGQMIGIVCHEHVGGARRWLPEDEQFAASIADLAALAVEASERLRAEEALRVSEASYRALVDRALVGIYRSTVDGRFLTVNPALVTMLGYDSIEEVLDLRLTDDVYADPDERERLIETYRAAERFEGLEATWKKKDGSPLMVRLFGRPLQDADGRLFGFEMTVEDVTERRALEAQLRQAQKMEAIGQLSGGIAHDFNNILTVIMATADLIDGSLDETQQDLRARERAGDASPGVQSSDEDRPAPHGTWVSRAPPLQDASASAPGEYRDPTHNPRCWTGGARRPRNDRADGPQRGNKRPGRHAGRRGAYHRGAGYLDR
jgi:PAS domain S-box-containing protein